MPKEPLDEQAKKRLEEYVKQLNDCMRDGSYSFTEFWAGRIVEVMNPINSERARKEKKA